MNAVLHQPSSDQKTDQKTTWVRVAMLTLTSPNLTPLALHKRQVLSFLSRLSCRLRVHLAVVVGSEGGNTHSHLALAVPANEAGRFLLAIKKHRFADWWNAKHDPVLTLWKPHLADRAMTYIAVKHDLWDRQPEVFCPRRSHACRKGNCPHR
jgi:hypothetical protein